MSEYQSIEEYANHVRRETSGILARLCAKFGPEHAVTVTVASLCEEAADIVQQSRMREEQASEYDLTALRVDVTTASNSETGFDGEE